MGLDGRVAMQDPGPRWVAPHCPCSRAGNSSLHALCKYLANTWFLLQPVPHLLAAAGGNWPTVLRAIGLLSHGFEHVQVGIWHRDFVWPLHSPTWARIPQDCYHLNI